MPEAQPLIVPLDGGEARVLAVEHRAVRLAVDRPGTLSAQGDAHAVLAPRRGEVREGADRFTELTVPAAGEDELRLDVTVGTVLDQLGF